MGASFRNSGEILQLAGCDRLTISPKFIDELKASDATVEHLLQMPTPDECTVEQMNIDEKTFRWRMNQDEMATQKLHEGIRGFAADLEKLDEKLMRMIQENA
jgi:transaldolase